eukprot:m.309201 g.309201  ORF g.309201 m.309201 type:complete len:707 (+) comp45781_c0_seq1:115-2235(+)
MATESRFPSSRRAAAVKKVFVGNLGNLVPEESLQRAFSPYGEITDILLIEDKQTGFKSYGFITFRNSKSAEDTITAMQNQIINGRRLTVQLAKSDQEKEHPTRYRERRSRSPVSGGYRRPRHRSRSREREEGRGRERGRRDWPENYDGYWGGQQEREYGRDRGRSWESDEMPRRRESRWNRESGGDDVFAGSSREDPDQGHLYQGWEEQAPDEFRYGESERSGIDQFKAFHQQIHSQQLGHQHHHQERYPRGRGSSHSHSQADDVPYRRISTDEDPYTRPPDSYQRGPPQERSHGNPPQRQQQQPNYHQPKPAASTYDYSSKRDEYPPKRDYYQDPDRYQPPPDRNPPSRQDTYTQPPSSVRQTQDYYPRNGQDVGDQYSKTADTGNFYRPSPGNARTATSVNYRDPRQHASSVQAGRQAILSVAPSAKPSSTTWDPQTTRAADYLTSSKSSRLSRWSSPSVSVTTDYAQSTGSGIQAQERSAYRFQDERSSFGGERDRIPPPSHPPQQRPTTRQSDSEGYSPTRPQLYPGAHSAAAGSSYSTRPPPTAHSSSSQYKSDVRRSQPVPSVTGHRGGVAMSAMSTSAQPRSDLSAISSRSTLSQSAYSDAYHSKSTPSPYGSGSGRSSSMTTPTPMSTTSTPSYWSSSQGAVEKSYGSGGLAVGGSGKARLSQLSREPVRFGFAGAEERDSSSSTYSGYSSFRQGKSS